MPSRGSVKQILRGWLPEVDIERDGDVARSVRKFMYDEPNARAVRDGVLNSPTLTTIRSVLSARGYLHISNVRSTLYLFILLQPVHVILRDPPSPRRCAYATGFWRASKRTNLLSEAHLSAATPVVPLQLLRY